MSHNKHIVDFINFILLFIIVNQNVYNVTMKIVAITLFGVELML